MGFALVAQSAACVLGGVATLVETIRWTPNAKGNFVVPLPASRVQARVPLAQAFAVAIRRVPPRSHLGLCGRCDAGSSGVSLRAAPDQR